MKGSTRCRDRRSGNTIRIAGRRAVEQGDEAVLVLAALSPFTGLRHRHVNRLIAVDSFAIPTAHDQSVGASAERQDRIDLLPVLLGE